jgi:DNA mismatch repair protein MutL
MPIQVLAPDVANQIAAGEVVERPASVVKELIENSLDASATEIRVEAREGGRRLIRVQDNGCGIAAADTHALFQRHATSKITRTEDLDHLHTLGFRGEALASIGSVAQVSLLTRTADEQVGTLLRVAAGQGIAREGAGTPPGTTITVEHLFANVPARLKFLKQATTEASHIQQIVTRYALAYPELRFSLVTDGKLAFQSTGSGKLYDVLVKVYGLETAAQMIEVARGDPEGGDPPGRKITVTGYIGAPGLNRSSRSYITLFINRRWFQDTSLTYGVIQAYHTLLMVGRYPMAVLFIDMDPAEVDVNVHPTKAEVRFRDNNAVFGAVQRRVRRTLTDLAPIPQVGFGGSPAPSGAPGSGGGLTWEQTAAWEQADAWGPAGTTRAGDWAARRDALLSAGTNHILNTSPTGTDAAGAADFDAEVPAKQGDGALTVDVADTAVPTAGMPTPPDTRPQLIPLLRVVGQMAGTYIVAEGPDGMYLIDQHAAHERILYEKLMAAHEGAQLEVQPLLEPLVLNLSPEQAGSVAEALPTLNEWGVSIEPFGGDSYLVRSLPAVLGGQHPESALTEIVDGLAQGVNAVEGSIEARLVTLICKGAAVKGGHTLTMVEMQAMVRQLEACRSPRTCPHGRPTMIHVTAVELARQFGRV